MSSSSSSSSSSLPIPHQQTQKPYWSEDPGLQSGGGTPFYTNPFEILTERGPLEIPYPEIRDYFGDGVYDFVYSDDFLFHTKDNFTEIDLTNPLEIIGGAFTPTTTTPFNTFLKELMQWCRNYNHDLHAVRRLLFRIRNQGYTPVTQELEDCVAAFKRSAGNLWLHLAKNDPTAPEGGLSPFEGLAVELLKLNGFIFSVRVGANETSGPAEYLFSSSSHCSISSMYSSTNPSSSSSSSAHSNSSSSGSSDSSSSGSSDSSSSLNSSSSSSESSNSSSSQSSAST